MRGVMESGTFWFSVAVVIVLGIGAGLSAAFWGDLAATGEGSRESLSTTVRNVMLMIGALLALPLAIWRGWVAEQQVKATNDSVSATHESITNQRFQAAAQMLGHDLSAVRLGAIHTLAQLARADRERYYDQTARLLASFIRQPRTGKGTDTTRVLRGSGRSVREDVSAAIDFVGSRTQEDIDFERAYDIVVDLHNMNFEGWDLKDLNLSRALLCDSYFGEAKLMNTDFTGADLSDCTFRDAFIGGAILRCAKLSNANFTEWYIDSDGRYAQWTHSGEERGAVVGLLQSQLDEALDDQENPPRLRNVEDAESREQLTWHGASAR